MTRSPDHIRPELNNSDSALALWGLTDVQFDEARRFGVLTKLPDAPVALPVIKRMEHLRY